MANIIKYSLLIIIFTSVLYTPLGISSIPEKNNFIDNYCDLEDPILAMDDFSENVVLQKKYTNNIIKSKKYAVLDNVVSEKINYLKKRDLNFPLIPALDIRKKLNLTLVIDNDFTYNISRALLFDEKMEFRKEFEFHRKRGCWFLFSINDQSLLNIAKKNKLVRKHLSINK